MMKYYSQVHISNNLFFSLLITCDGRIFYGLLYMNYEFILKEGNFSGFFSRKNLDTCYESNYM